jgi:hypothetical protein
MSADTSHPHGEVFLDARGQGRALRLTWHHEADVVVLSLWRDRMCAGTFRLSTADVNEFVDALVEGLREAPADGEAATAPPSTPPSTPPSVVPRTGAIDVRPSAPAPDADDDDGFVAWALRGGDGRASA